MALDHNPDNPDHVAVRGSQTFRRWYNCVVCGLSWPADQLRFFNGAPYGVPCECYLDLQQLAHDPVMSTDSPSMGGDDQG